MESGESKVESSESGVERIEGKQEKLMAGFKRFEDIVAWQKARELTRLIYEVTAERNFSNDYGFQDQIRRSAVSIMANIAEGHGRRSDREFANFLNIARASAMEVQSHLYVALDLNRINQQQFEKLYSLAGEISGMLFNLIKHLKKS